MSTEILHPISEYSGVDVNIEISLCEYGIAWFDAGNEWHFIYGIKRDDKGNFCRFDVGWFDKKIDCKKEFGWADLEDVVRGMDLTVEEWLTENTLPVIIADLYVYYGYENIFGSTYWEGYTWKELANHK